MEEPGVARQGIVQITHRFVSPQGAASLSRAFLFRGLASLWLRTSSLDGIMNTIAIRKRAAPDNMGDSIEAGAIAWAFDRITPFVAVDDCCLSISLALMMAMLNRRILAALVIGMRTAPFGAHCWEQIEDALVNGETDLVRGFSPILAVFFGYTAAFRSPPSRQFCCLLNVSRKRAALDRT